MSENQVHLNSELPISFVFGIKLRDLVKDIRANPLNLEGKADRWVDTLFSYAYETVAALEEEAATLKEQMRKLNDRMESAEEEIRKSKERIIGAD